MGGREVGGGGVGEAGELSNMQRLTILFIGNEWTNCWWGCFLLLLILSTYLLTPDEDLSVESFCVSSFLVFRRIRVEYISLDLFYFIIFTVLIFAKFCLASWFLVHVCLFVFSAFQTWSWVYGPFTALVKTVPGPMLAPNTKTFTGRSIVSEFRSCKGRGGRPGPSVLMSLTLSVDVKQYWTVPRCW